MVKKPEIVTYLDDTNFNVLLSVIHQYTVSEDSYLSTRAQKLENKLLAHTFVDMQEDEEGGQTPFAKMAFFSNEIEPLCEILVNYIRHTDMHNIYSERYFAEIMDKEKERKATNPDYGKFNKPQTAEQESAPIILTEEELNDKPF